MILALVGTHGTGKATVFDRLKALRPSWQYFSEAVRHQMPAFGYRNAYEVVDEVGIGAFELANINAWSVLDPGVNSLFRTDVTTIIDRSPVDNYATTWQCVPSILIFLLNGTSRGWPATTRH